MATRETPWPAGTPCWVDISVPDVAAGSAFYAAVLGWELVDTGEEFGHYRIAQVDGRAAAGLGPVMTEGAPTAWTLYFASDDADGTAKLVTEHGGTLLFEPMEIAGNGRMCIAADPTGAVFGVWQSLGMIGAGVVNEPGGLVWEDGRLTDPEAGRAFYADVFGFTYRPVDGAPPGYTTFHAGGDPLGGIGGVPEGTPSHWLAYFSVASVGSALQAVREGGGSVVTGPDETPWGQMAVIQDPFGATLGLFGSA
jgi:uncharacterized protein